MNWFHIHGKLALTLTAITVTLLIVATAARSEACKALLADMASLFTDAGYPGPATDHVPKHCLVFGKYCLGDALHSR
jgi:hypothetical protein